VHAPWNCKGLSLENPGRESMYCQEDCPLNLSIRSFVTPWNNSFSDSSSVTHCPSLKGTSGVFHHNEMAMTLPPASLLVHSPEVDFPLLQG